MDKTCEDLGSVVLDRKLHSDSLHEKISLRLVVITIDLFRIFLQQENLPVSVIPGPIDPFYNEVYIVHFMY